MRLCTLAYDSCVPIVRVVVVAVVVVVIVITAIADFPNSRMMALGESQFVSKTKYIV